ncbi:hypothetical protein NADFUDRAFT_83153 [Nadsonia fulvescens var. elongata DSM 6958]|uniref:GOLD domain-containing protein n=1 Tax=Nadsonia fulvescens var. elongata DSM 6958 TaxID=857566 RepID=A0A1E3PI13_9ASCO|nr:hypothetical protein NADFUDRAFT_83153 [Nadsonia fulvescens var. elongata DSM 6958]
MKLLFLVLAITAVFSPVSALHFYLDGGEQRCFFEELPKGTIVVGKYDAKEYDQNSGSYSQPDNLGIHLTVEETFDNNHRIVSQKADPNGEFSFSSLESGEHKICLRSTSHGWFSSNKVKIALDLAIGEGSHIDSKGEDKVSSLSERVQQINMKLTDIRREQQLMREREAGFRNQSESTNARVVRWTVIQLFILGITCAWQLTHLRSFFVKQKLV